MNKKKYGKNRHKKLFSSKTKKPQNTTTLNNEQRIFETKVDFTFDKFLILIFGMGLFIFFSTWIEPLLLKITAHSQNGVLDAVKLLFSAAGTYAIYILKSVFGRWKFIIIGFVIILLLPLVALLISYIILLIKKTYIGKNLVK